MNGLSHRLRKIEDRIQATEGNGIQFVFVEPGEPESNQENVLFISWADTATWPTNKPANNKGVALSIDQEIKQIVGELQGEGYSLEDIAAMVQEQAPVISEPERAPQPQEARPAEGQTMEALKASDLVRLFAGRRR